MDPIRFGTDGWRARYGEGYTEDNVVRVTDAVARTFARKYPEGTIVVGYDTRRDGKRFAELAAGVLAGYGFDVKLSDSFCPTPAISWNVAHDPAAVGGVVLTASHGSGAYNGLKVRMEDGGASPKEFTDAVEAAVVPHPTDLRGAFVTVDLKRIYKEMLKGDVILGGEESGGIGIPRYMPERDGLLVMLIVCELMARKGKTLGQLVEGLEDKVGRMEYGRRDLSLDSTLLQMFQNVLPGLNPQQIAGMRPVEVSHTDGLRLGFADESWLLVRPSGTEPVVRVYAEAPSVEARDALLDAGCALAQGEF